MVERAYGVLTQKLLECGVSKEVYELDPESIYSYQDSFNFIADIKDGDLSLWCDAPWEYLRFLKYKRNVIKYEIEVTATLRNLDIKGLI